MSEDKTQNNPENKIVEILELLNKTFKSSDNQQIKEATIKLNQIFANIKTSINFLFVALSYKSISGKEIPLALHKSAALYLKNLITKQFFLLDEDEIYQCIRHIFELIFMKSKENPNLNNNTIFSTFQEMIIKLLSSSTLKENKNYIYQLFDTILTYLKNVNKENILQISKSVILLSSTLFSSDIANCFNYEQLLNNYYIPITENIFSQVPIFLNPKENIYNIEFITIIKLMLEGFFLNLGRMKSIIQNSKVKEITMKFFKNYGNYCFELIQLMPLFDKETEKKFGNPNIIIVFNSNKKLCYEINSMKSKAFQFLSFITQTSTLKEKTEDNSNFINDQDLQKMIMSLITLIMNSFQDILNNKEKFNFIRKYSEEINDEEDCFNIILYNMFVFLNRSMIREPIKTNLSSNIRQILLNILFPLIVTVEDEKIFLQNDSEQYHHYINDITISFKRNNFRTSACFLIKKICNEFEGINYFVLSFCIEMLNYIINEGKIKKDLSEFNTYLKYKTESLIVQFNDKIKLDFALLIFLILNENINQIPYLKNKFLQIFLDNYTKFHSIPFTIIKIKLCKIYHFYLQMFFDKEQKFKNEIMIKFIEDVVIYLLNCIIQSNLNTNEGYIEALSYEASLVITELMNIEKNDDELINIGKLKYYLNQNLEKNFEIMIKLIPNNNIYIFFLLLEQIISKIKINPRNLIFEVLDTLTKKFLLSYSEQKNENKLFFTQFFNIINSLLKGENKILPENKEEISKFNEYYDSILYFLNNPNEFEYHELIISNAEQCIKSFDGISERSILILKSIKLIIKKDECISEAYYNYVSTFLYYIHKIKCQQAINGEDIFNDILDIIKLSFSFKDESLKISTNYALLLTLQLLNINQNLNSDVFEYLLLQSFDSFEFLNKNEYLFNFVEDVNQLSLAIISFGFIFKPEETFKILQKKRIIQEEEIIEYVRIDRYINMIGEVLKISYPDYYPSLGKCIILGICSIFSNNYCQDVLKNENEFKSSLLIIFIKLTLKQKMQKCLILENMMQKELKCNFVESPEEEEEDDDDIKEGDTELQSLIDQVVNINENIKLTDEFEFFSKVMKNIRENEGEMYEFICNQKKKAKNIIEELSKIRNIKIKYQEKEYWVPRKTVKIIKKLN